MLNKIIIPLFLVFNFSASAAEIIEGRVVGVHDGDTITLLISGNKQLKIRLAQIDAPELAQAFGQKSKQSLSDLVFSKSIKVEQETVDKYGRTVGTLIVDGVDANREQVKRGMAWVYRHYLRDKTLLRVEDEARQSKVGLWSESDPTPPWEFRHGKKGVAKTASPAKTAARSTSSGFTCGSKKYCKEMVSCDEAKFYLTQCGADKLDGNHDGVPCEKLCETGRQK
jgi:endonuclease YncB( thermonuclease family)